jgi:hypothetical protein
MSSISHQCPCGARWQFKSKHAGKSTKCGKCDADIVIPAATVEKDETLSVTGEHQEAVAHLREFLVAAQQAELPSNPLRKTAARLTVTVKAVREGNAFVRYMFGSIVGRPRVHVSYEFDDGDGQVANGLLTKSAFLIARQDAGFRGGAFGGSGDSYIRTNCRHLAGDIVEDIVRNSSMSAEEQAAFVQAAQGPRASNTRYYIIAALAMPIVPIEVVVLPLAWRLRKKAQSSGNPTKWHTALLAWSTLWLLFHIFILIMAISSK